MRSPLPPPASGGRRCARDGPSGAWHCSPRRSGRVLVLVRSNPRPRREVPVGHPPLDVEGRLDVVLPRLPALYPNGSTRLCLPTSRPARSSPASTPSSSFTVAASGTLTLGITYHASDTRA